MIPLAAPSVSVIRAHHVSFTYGTSLVLDDVDVALARGEVTVVAGENGAGKSTLIEILAGVRRPSDGTVSRSQDVALVVQRPSAPDALPVTVRDVVAMGTWERQVSRWWPISRTRRSEEIEESRRRVGLLERRRRVGEALERMQLTDLADHPFNVLSGGQRQRALLAQGIARGAGVLLLDEPATGLDAESRERTHEVLADEARRGAAVALVTHDEDAIAAADVVVRLERGRRVS